MLEPTVGVDGKITQGRRGTDSSESLLDDVTDLVVEILLAPGREMDVRPGSEGARQDPERKRRVVVDPDVVQREA
ncbi:MAG TPA: hypothetical protein VK283_13530 [Acidimicrobiales bacterium]|nr:hypothetical protein [Acidimicrobiales bacterium]